MIRSRAALVAADSPREVNLANCKRMAQAGRAGRWGLLALAAFAWTAAAIAEPLAEVIERHIRQQLGRDQEGIVVSVLASEQQLALAGGCPRLAASHSPGQRLVGRTHIAVRCSGTPGWQVWIPVKVQHFGRYPVAARRLSGGTTIAAGDLRIVAGDLALLPADAVVSASRLAGKELTHAAAENSPIRQWQVRQPLLVRRGESVAVIVRGGAFQAASRGVALGEGGMGEGVAVRLASGAMRSGRVIGRGQVELE